MLVVFYSKFTTEPSILQTWWHYILSNSLLYGRLTEPLSEEKKMIKLIKRFIVFIFLTSVLFSCSLLDSQNEASITFTIDRNMA